MQIAEIVDTDRYPVTETDSPRWREAVDAVRQALAADGCSVLAGFVRPQARARLVEEAASLEPLAHDVVEQVNVYNTAPDSALPAEHPAHVEMVRGNAFVARDRIPADHVVALVYADPGVRAFLAACTGEAELHGLADPYAGLTLNVVGPGRAHPWHFDTNEVAVSLLLRPAERGGTFEWCPGIREPHDEHLADVRAVLDGSDRTRVRRSDLCPGDLQVFHGRFSLHRVTRVEGDTARLTAILAYSSRPGVVGTPERTRQLFGRVSDLHREAQQADDLLV